MNCDCKDCNPSLIGLRMFVCSDCGSKRCARAFWHGWNCENAADVDDYTAQESPVVDFPWLAPAVIAPDQITHIRDLIDTVPADVLDRIKTRVMAEVDPVPFVAGWFDVGAA